MSEKSLRDARPGGDQVRDPAAPPAPSGGRSSDSGGAPVEPWAGDRTDRVSGREGSGARVALVPAVSADGRIEVQASTADTRRVTDSGRTTLMGVPSPFAAQSDKPTTTPGHDVHLPADKGRVADARPIAVGGGVIPSVELDPSSTRRIGKVEAPGKASGDIAGQDRGGDRGEDQGRDRSEKSATKPAGDGNEKDNGNAAAVPHERTMAAAAATFRASLPGGGNQAGASPGDHEADRTWTADRTQEFHLDPPPTASAFGKTLAIGIALAASLGILVVSFIHSRVRGAASDQGEVARAAAPLPLAPLPLPPPPPPENPVPPPAVEPTNAAPTAEAPTVEPPAEPTPPTTDAIDETALGKSAAATDRRPGGRGKTPTPAGRTASPARTPRAAASLPREGLMPLPGAPSLPASAGAPTSPPPLTAAPPPERPTVKAEPSRTEGAKPYDPDMPLPPSAE